MTDEAERAVVPAGLAARLAELFPGARVVAARSLAPDEHADDEAGKAVGYGEPMRIALQLPDGTRREVVFHVAQPNDFGHDRRSDRAQQMLLAWDTFRVVPRHAEALDVGAVVDDGSLVSLARSGEHYLITAYCPGVVYAEDLRRVGESGEASVQDGERCEALARYLVELHRAPGSHPGAYVRAIRDLVGHGEGIAGLCDAYADDVPAAPRSRIEALERSCLEWRFRLRARTGRLRRTHGDFHPFNIVFREGIDFTVLDASRGCEGDPADDVACMALNYLFFAVGRPGARGAGPRALWSRFWETYLAGSGDADLLDVVAPFLAWRSLVVASPIWYPHVGADERDRVLRLAERALAAPRFDPAWGLEALA
jgi:aminoglycoside phosphotransferase (APT) family kinase protein